MKLFKLRLTTLKSKLYAIVFASFIVRVVVFFALPNTASNLAPDEGNYRDLAAWIAAGKPAEEYWMSNLYKISRSLIFPASLLNRLGLSGIDSVRLISSTYGILALLLVTFTLLKSFRINDHFRDWATQNEKTILLLMLAYAFLPSRFVWSILGLRESALEFWTISVLALLLYITSYKHKATIFSSIGFVIALSLVFSSRYQIGWLVGITVLVYLILGYRTLTGVIVLFMTFGGMVIGYGSISITSYSPAPIFSVTPIKDEPNLEVVNKLEVRLLCKYDGQTVRISSTPFNCVLQNPGSKGFNLANPAAQLIKEGNAISIHHKANQVGAESAIPTLECPLTGNSKTHEYFCLAYRAPYSAFTFLFRPLIGLDTTSTTSLLASIENVGWLLAILFIAVGLARNRRLAFSRIQIPSIIFFILYSVIAGSYEGNMGTAFRHKSLILWVVLLLIASTIVAAQQRKAEQQEISGSSQE
jgi:hypothetical protein